MEDPQPKRGMSRRKRWLIVAIVFTLVLGAGAWYLKWMMSQPLYNFGSVAAAKNLRGPLEPPQQKTADQWLVEPDISLSFDKHGQGQAVLVIHGGPGIPYASLWKGLEGLTDRFEFYYYHQRGAGDSTRAFDRLDSSNYYENMMELEGTLGLGAQIADIERIRRILKQEKLTLIGHSYGGFIATLYAAEFPDRVDKLILVAPAGVLTAPDEERNLFDLARGKLAQDKRQQFDADMKEYFDFGNIFSKSEADLIDVHQRVGRHILSAMGYSENELTEEPRGGGWCVFAIYFSTGHAQDYRPALDYITADTLILHGQDVKISLPGARTYEAIRNSKLVLLEREDPERRAGHFIYDDSPKKFGESVEQFLVE
jgi:proline iminopeptidase